jgi:hypothetical protein
MGVDFEEQVVPVEMKIIENPGGAVTRAFISMGIAHTPKDARIVMIIVALIALTGSGYVAYGALNKKTPPLTDQQKQVIKIQLDSVVRQ